MFKHKIFIMAVSVLIAITLILTAAFVLWNYVDKVSQPELTQQSAKEAKPVKKLTADQAKENTYIIKDVLTNLAGNDKFIRVSFAFELENKKARDEFEKLDFKMKSIIVQTLADMTSDQIQGSKGSDQLGSILMNKMNPLLTEGKLIQIWITDKVLQ